jgi:hypothetical protein
MPTTLLLAGKRVAAPVLQLHSASLAGASLLHLTDDTTGLRYLVDSDAALCLLPHRSMLPPSGPLIINANGGRIPSWQFVDRSFILAITVSHILFCKQTFLNLF